MSILGEISMEKVHVRRYVAGKRPEWANEVESDSEEEQDKVIFGGFVQQTLLMMKLIMPIILNSLHVKLIEGVAITCSFNCENTSAGRQHWLDCPLSLRSTSLNSS